MTDLNLAATVTDGGSRAGYEWSSPGNANDGNSATTTISGSGVEGAVTVARKLKSDLGSAHAVASMTIVSETYDGGDPGWTVEFSSDGASWSPVTGYGYVNTYLGGEENRQDITFDQVTKRYWRITTSITFGSGLHFVTDAHVWTWSILDVPPPPPPEPGTGVDFDDDGFDSDDELAGYLISYTVTRGAGPTVIGGASVGTASLILKNTDDRFNPLNSGGPYFGKLRDGKPMWLGMNSDGASTGLDPRGLFGGRTVDWIPLTVGGATVAPTVELTGEDALGWFRRTPCRVSDSVGRSQRDLRVAMLAAGGETRYDVANEILHVPLSSFDGQLLDGLEAINSANGTRHFVKPQDDRTDWYRYTTRNRQWRLDATVDGSLNAGSDHVQADGFALSADTVTNQQKATATPIYFTPSSMIVWEAPVLPFTFSGTRVMWLEFDDYVDAPDTDVNYTGTAPTITLEAFGSTAKMTLVSAGTTTVTSLLVHGRLVRRGLAESHVANDTASQAGTRGIRAGSDLSGDFIGTLATASGIAEHVVWRYADPQLRPTLTVENWLPHQFEIDLYDIIAVTVAQLSMTAVLFEVVGLTHQGDLAASAALHLHTTTYVLQQCRVQTDPGWFVLDTSELDSADVLAY